MNRSLLLFLLVLLLLAACTPAPTASPLSPSPTLTPRPQPLPTPLATFSPAASPTPSLASIQVLSITHIPDAALEVRLFGFPAGFDDEQYTFWVDDQPFDCPFLRAFDDLMICIGDDLPAGSPGILLFREVDSEAVAFELPLDLASAGTRLPADPAFAQDACPPPVLDAACLDSTWYLRGQDAWSLFCRLHPEAPFCYQPYEEMLGLRCGFCTTLNGCSQPQTFDWFCTSGP